MIRNIRTRIHERMTRTRTHARVFCSNLYVHAICFVYFYYYYYYLSLFFFIIIVVTLCMLISICLHRSLLRNHTEYILQSTTVDERTVAPNVGKDIQAELLYSGPKARMN